MRFELTTFSLLDYRSTPELMRQQLYARGDQLIITLYLVPSRNLILAKQIDTFTIRIHHNLNRTNEGLNKYVSKIVLKINHVC